MLTLLYHAEATGPVCHRVAKVVPDCLQVADDNNAPFIHEGIILRWGSVYRNLLPCINTAEAVALAKDHKQTRQALLELSPETWYQYEDIPLGKACVVRPARHHAGNKFYTCHHSRETRHAIRRCGHSWYASALIDKAHEYRVFVCQNYVVAVSERFPAAEGDMAWNLAMGGKLINLDRKQWPIPAVKASILAAKRLGLDWCAIDVALDQQGKAWVFEANTAPGLRNPYTIKQIAHVLAWISDGNVYEPKPVKNEDRWQNLLHPALQ